MPRTRQVEKLPVIVSAVKAIRLKAILFIINGSPVWIPKSQLHEPEEIQLTDEQTEIHVTSWFVKKEGLYE